MIAAQPLRARGRWLVAVPCGQPAQDFTVRELPGTAPRVSGGDVLVRVRAGTCGMLAGTPRVEVWAVVRGSVIPVAAWDDLPSRGWPVVIRPAVAFAMTVLAQLSEFIGLSYIDPVPLRGLAWGGPVGLPPLTWPGGHADRM